MKTNKLKSIIMMFVIVLGTTIVFTSCGDDKEETVVVPYPDKQENKPASLTSYCPDNNHPHAIDLNLSSGTKWSCMNVGASSPEDYGGYYAWGETNEKDEYSKETVVYYDPQKGYQNIGKDIAGTSYDVAHVKMRGSWKMPSSDQLEELLTNCTHTFTQINGVNGYLVTGSNGNSIFLPAAGYRFSNNLSRTGSEGDYWSSTLSASGVLVQRLYFSSNNGKISTHNRYYGHSVRAVCQ